MDLKKKVREAYYSYLKNNKYKRFLNNINAEGNTDSDEDDLFDYIKASSHTTEEEDPLYKRLERKTRAIASKAVDVCQKVMDIYASKGGDTKTRSRLPIIASKYRRRFESVLRSPNPINEDSSHYLVSGIETSRGCKA
eukprot:TRINITY_DN2718_c0_g1_i15.p1 TRINITY_DN2718_c0_g1~~TRINITY_DN2718_c0_g1_i15.p1  ORF type:complete len:138 (+),score=29.87 TRINITY_DN2718_c0_g1_i15:125-538(+)